MTIVNLRTFNKLCGAALGLLAVFASTLSVEGSGGRLLFILGPVLVGLVYFLACLLEPAWVHRRHRHGSGPARLPFAVKLLPYQFRVELKEVLHFEKGIEGPAFSSGHPASPRRIYLREGIEERFNPQQMQGLFASQLADLALERDTRLWAAGALVFILLFAILVVVLHLLPGVAITFQMLLAIVPVLVAALDLLFVHLSRTLIFRSDRFATRVLVYPDCLLDYLEALARLEGEDGEARVSPRPKLKRSAQLKRFSLNNPFPAALERLERLGEIYPEAERLFRELKKMERPGGLEGACEQRIAPGPAHNRRRGCAGDL